MMMIMPPRHKGPHHDGYLRTHGDTSDDDPVWSRRIEVDHAYAPSAAIYHSNSHPRMIPHTGGNSVPQATVVRTTRPRADSDIYKIGIYGWRKRCLFAFLIILTIVIVINLAMTLWIMTVLNFSSEGIGALKIEREGIRVAGRSEFQRAVKVSQISTPDDEALSIESRMGILMSAHNASGYATASLNLGQDGKATVVCDKFEVLDSDRKLLFFADPHEIGLKLENLRILDDGGSIFEGAIQTAIVRPEPNSPLSLESPTRNLNIEAAQDIELLSGAGEIQLNSLLDINLRAKQGDIRLESGNIYVSGLEKSSAQGKAQHQLCVCQNGRLFMAAERADCRADRGTCD